MSKEKQAILRQLSQSQIVDPILPLIPDTTPGIYSFVFSHPIQVENLMPIPMTLRFKMPALKLLSKFISKNIIYGDCMKDLKTLMKSEVNMYTSKEINLPILGEGFVEDIHPFNGVLLSLALPDYDKSDFHDVMDPYFKEALKSYLRVAPKQQEFTSVFQTQDDDYVSAEHSKHFSNTYTFNKIFQFFSEKQNEQLNVCLETVFYKGNLKLTFFSQYWFLNETCFPLMIRFTEGSYQYDPITLDASNGRVISNDSKEAGICWLPEGEAKVNDNKLSKSGGFTTRSEGLQVIKSKGVEEKLIHSNSLDNSFFSLKSSQLSKAYVDSLLKTKSKYIKLITTNLTENTETIMDASIEDFTEWSNQLLISNFSSSEPCIEMLEKVYFDKDKIRDKDKSAQDHENAIPMRLFELCLNVVQLPGKLNRTKLVLMCPKYVIVNSTKCGLLVGQLPNNKHAFGQIPAEHAVSFHWNFKDKAKNLFLRVDKKNYLWSPGFSVEKPTNFSFRMRSLDDQDMQIFSVNVRIWKILVI